MFASMQSMQAWCLHCVVSMMHESFSILQTEHNELGIAINWDDLALFYRMVKSSSE